MIFSDYRFSLDVHDTSSQVSLSFKQGDTGRILYIMLTEEGKIFEIPPDCVAVFTSHKPDGTIIFNDCEINGNEIRYAVTPQSTVIPGKQDCELRLYGAGDSLITSPHFTCFVHPTVYADKIIESKDEVNTLTHLVSEASTKLANGDFVPKLTVGEVATLPSGAMATVEIAGTPEAPVLNFAIPQGPEGQAEHLIPDTALSADSIKPVQNKVIAEAINALAQNTAEDIAEATAALAATIEKVDSDNTESLNTLAEEVANKVEKESGKGLSTNDYTNTEKQKLAGIAEGANKYTLPVGGSAIGGVKNGGDIAIDSAGNMTIKDGTVDTAAVGNGAIARTKLAQDALYSPMRATGVNSIYAITLDDMGKTIAPSSGAENTDVVYTLSADVANNLPYGAEIAILRRSGKSLKINFASEVSSAIVGDSSMVSGRTYEIPDMFGMVAIKKISYTDTSSSWLVTGNVEVVE